MAGRAIDTMTRGLFTQAWNWGCVAVAVSAFLTCARMDSVAAKEEDALIGSEAPEWSVTNWLNSKAFSLDDLRGKVILIRWWTGPECPYCAASVPYLNTWYEKYRNKGLVVIGFYHHKSPTPLTRSYVQELIKRYEVSFPVAIDPEWHTLKRWWLDEHPRAWTSVSFLIDRGGVIRYIHPGGTYAPEEAETLESTIRSLLGIQRAASGTRRETVP